MMLRLWIIQWRGEMNAGHKMRDALTWLFLGGRGELDEHNQTGTVTNGHCEKLTIAGIGQVIICYQFSERPSIHFSFTVPCVPT